MDKKEKHTYKDSLKELIPYAVIIVTVVLIRTFIITPIKVNGTSMMSTLHDGDTMILNKIGLKTTGIKRFQIVVIKTENSYLIKRVIGLPGELIKYSKDTLYVNGKKVDEKFINKETKKLTCNNDTKLCSDGVKIPKGYYYVMGDNRGNSIDSRIIGTINIKDITGTTKLIIFPLKNIGIAK